MVSLANRVDKLRNKGKQPNLAQIAYTQIKEAIIFAKFKPGEYISENMLAAALEMSRTPVREALKELAYENLVEIMPGREAVVKHITQKDLKEIFELRRVLECFAAETAPENFGDDEIKEIEETWMSFQKKVEQGRQIEWEALSHSDNKLHSMIIDKCNNAHLKNFMSVLGQQILRYQLLTAMALGDMADTIRQHLEIIALLKARETKELIPVLRQHIEEAEKILMKSHFEK
ncbi:DNA-binding transcriptional regulator, GntR family [Desulfotomaculum arcticum]|uniref:DNA-binding transcriptional regulator, GntR family n=1 Tax=Desulfotruncus arcticus DSM 17038 TaxID=1121424 RepID=A0A1I2ZQH5_9FIRM|nr:GntR family transcriptional regulator [Desulfotruncus arcticus]SFH40073.1 DNA-binding transcriptional regulator, GntR family [Desulfotomaculum arcticum] [Desulfotruncus arcticus DSM 17038]